MANNKIVTLTKKFMLYNKRQHLQHTVPRPLQLKPTGHALSEQEWTKFCNKSLIPVKLHHFCERSGNGSLIFFGEGGVDAAFLLQQKFPDRFHFILDCSDKITAEIGAALAEEIGLDVLEVSYKEMKENHSNVRNINDPQNLAELAEEGRRILNESNIKLA